MADGLKISVQFRWDFLSEFDHKKGYKSDELFTTVFSLWFSGGAELLFNKVKEHEVLLPKNENPCG